MKNKFDFYEVVKINSKNSALGKINGKEGVVLGMAQDDGNWSYAVSVENKGWSTLEEDLLPTGKFAKRSDFYSDDETSRIKVVVDKNGKGRIKDE